MKVIVKNSKVVFQTKTLPRIEHLMRDAFLDRAERILENARPNITTGDIFTQSGIHIYLYDISQLPKDATFSVKASLNYSDAGVFFYSDKPVIGVNTGIFIGKIIKNEQGLVPNVKSSIEVPSGTKWIVISGNAGPYGDVSQVYATYAGEPENP